MITGFNTDIEYNGKVYHVQTEDRGLKNPIVESLVYTGGEIITSCKTPYTELIENGGCEEDQVLRRMEDQHRDLIREIQSGKFDPDDGMPFGHGIVTNRSLDEVVRSFLEVHVPLERIHLEMSEPEIVWEGEPATFRLRVLDPDTERPIGGATVIVKLVATGSPSKQLVSASSDDDGLVELLCNIPTIPDSNAAIVCQAEADGTTAELQRLVKRRERVV